MNTTEIDEKETPISMEQFINCFRPQFSLQRGHGGVRHNKYYPNTRGMQNLGIKTDTWVMMAFIYCAQKTGFSFSQIVLELRVKPSLVETLRDELPNILHSPDGDLVLRKHLKTKIGLVRNSIWYKYQVDINKL